MEEIPMAMKKSVVLPFVRSSQKLELFANALGKPPVPHVIFLSSKKAWKFTDQGRGAYINDNSWIHHG